jgi:hypothetical protein
MSSVALMPTKHVTHVPNQRVAQHRFAEARSLCLDVYALLAASVGSYELDEQGVRALFAVVAFGLASVLPFRAAA